MLDWKRLEGQRPKRYRLNAADRKTGVEIES
jgi:hypothetical protein